MISASEAYERSIKHKMDQEKIKTYRECQDYLDNVRCQIKKKVETNITKGKDEAHFILYESNGYIMPAKFEEFLCEWLKPLDYKLFKQCNHYTRDVWYYICWGEQTIERFSLLSIEDEIQEF